MDKAIEIIENELEYCKEQYKTYKTSLEANVSKQGARFSPYKAVMDGYYITKWQERIETLESLIYVLRESEEQ